MTYGKIQKGYYAISIGPAEQYVYGTPKRKHDIIDPDLRLKQFRSAMYELVMFLPRWGVHYKLHVEISEKMYASPGTPRLHMHGLLHFGSKKAIRHFWLSGYNRLSQDAQVYIKPIRNVEVWKRYCLKHDWLDLMPPLESDPDVDLWVDCKVSPKHEDVTVPYDEGEEREEGTAGLAVPPPRMGTAKSAGSRMPHAYKKPYKKFKK